MVRSSWRANDVRFASVTESKLARFSCLSTAAIPSRGLDARTLPAIALTAFVQNDDAREALAAVFQVHLGKPVNVYELTVVISRLAGRAR